MLESVKQAEISVIKIDPKKCKDTTTSAYVLSVLITIHQLNERRELLKSKKKKKTDIQLSASIENNKKKINANYFYISAIDSRISGLQNPI